MRYCTRCGTEYKDDVVDCSDCGQGLVGQAEWEAFTKEETDRRERLRNVEMVRACRLAGRIEADRLIGALDEEGIPAFVRSFVDTAFDGLWVGQKGWGEMWVAKNRLEEAQKLIEALKGSVEDDEATE